MFILTGLFPFSSEDYEFLAVIWKINLLVLTLVNFLLTLFFISFTAIMYAKCLATQNVFTGNFLLIIAKSAAKALHGLNVLTKELWL